MIVRRLLVSPFLIGAALMLAGCPARLDSRNPEKRLQAVAQTTDQAALARVAQQDPDRLVSNAAWAKLTDQTLLQIALAASGRDLTSKNIRSRALEHLTGQEQLIRLAQESPDAFTARGAVLRITTQDALASIALTHEDHYVREAATAKVADPALRIRLATEAKHADVRLKIASGLDDESFLVRLAAQDTDRRVRNTALSRLKDSTLLKEVAVRSPIPEARGAAATALAGLSLQLSEAAHPEHGVSWQNLRAVSDQLLLARCALSQSDHELRRGAMRQITDAALLSFIAAHGDRMTVLMALEQLADTDSLEYLAGDLDSVVAAIARLKLVLQDTRLTARHPRLRIEISRTSDWRTYETVTTTYRTSSPPGLIESALGQMPADAQVTGTSKGKPISVAGEGLRIELFDAHAPLVVHGWAASFPDEINLGNPFSRGPQTPIEANVRTEDLLAKLLARPEFIPDDLGQIIRDSSFTELRLGATRNLTDQALLARLATGKEDYRIRLAATERLHDQAVLAAIAIDRDNLRDQQVIAATNLTDQLALGKLAEDASQPKEVRMVAIQKINDERLLARIATGKDYSPGSSARVAAIERITDRTVLTALAKNESPIEVSLAATNRLTRLSSPPPLLDPK